jgi:hypothetical protein
VYDTSVDRLCINDQICLLQGWIVKWAIGGPGESGGVAVNLIVSCYAVFQVSNCLFQTSADIAFTDLHTLWAQHSSGTFSQLDLRYSYKPIDVIPRTSLTWEAGGGVAFVSGKKARWEVPFDDMYVGFSFLFWCRMKYVSDEC